MNAVFLLEGGTMQFQKGSGDWDRKYNSLSKLTVDLHDSGKPFKPYHELMAEAHSMTMEALQKAQQEGFDYVLVLHGSSTSRPGKTTKRSIVRSLMRSKESTPYIIKSKSIQQETVFLAAIRPLTHNNK
ncbi:MAG: hypothetical protein PF482_11580 [Desulfobacteraceae bacterium]|nr:hypothetical protein [Desulfobacteraceae bacterium]